MIANYVEPWMLLKCIVVLLGNRDDKMPAGLSGVCVAVVNLHVLKCTTPLSINVRRRELRVTWVWDAPFTNAIVLIRPDVGRLIPWLVILIGRLADQLHVDEPGMNAPSTYVSKMNVIGTLLDVCGP